jgi:glucose dehydrogenase
MTARSSKLWKYLTTSTVALGMLAATPVFADDALDQALKSDSNWPMYGRTYDNTRFSPLTFLASVQEPGS